MYQGYKHPNSMIELAKSLGHSNPKRVRSRCKIQDWLMDQRRVKTALRLGLSPSAPWSLIDRTRCSLPPEATEAELKKALLQKRALDIGLPANATEEEVSDAELADIPDP